MGNGNFKKGGGGGDAILESRHLMGLFLGVVVLCGVFFTLGYVMGRTQYDSSVRAAPLSRASAPPAGESSAAANKAASSPSDVPPDWTFYKAGDPKKGVDSILSPAKKPAPAETAPPAAPNSPAKSVAGSRTESSPRTKPAASVANSSLAASRAQLKPPAMLRGAIVLQVAALTRENDALALAGALQQKEFPAFVLNPDTGNLYRVQVGPYADAQSANIAKRSLEREGFKSIVKR